MTATAEKPERTARFGWCLTGQHAGTPGIQCPGVTASGLRCGCDCHQA